MAYRYPYGNTEQMNLDWFLNQWEKFKADWAEAEAGIDGSLDAEIAKVEAAMSELYAARDAAAASASAARQSSLDAAAAQIAAGNSKTAAQAAETSARGSQQAAAQSAHEARASAQGAENSALTASQAANTATQQAAGADAARGAAEAAQQAAEGARAAAAQSAGQAGQAATAAADHADDAADSATLAQQAAQDMTDSVEQITTNKNDISDLKESINNNENQLPENTITGYMPTIYDGAKNIPIVSSNITGDCTVIGKSLPYNLMVGKSLNDDGTEATDNYYNTYIVNTENMTTIVASAYRTATGYRYLKAFGYNEDETEITSLIVGGGNPQNGFLRFINAEGYHHIKLSWANNLNKIVFSNIYKVYTTGQIIKTFKGENTFARSGLNYNITYKCDIAEYVKNSFKLVAKVLNDMIADTALVENDFRIVNNTLYRVTAPIASGGTLTVGTNVIATTVVDVLKSLLN